MKNFILLPLILFASAALASPFKVESKRLRTLANGTQYAILTRDGDVSRVLLTEENEGKLPLVLKSERYQSHDQADRRWRQLSRGWSDFNTNAPPTNAPATEAQNIALWSVTQQWSIEWENKYAQWIEAHLNRNYFLRDLETDCADIVYALRWIFARENGLPAANRLGGSGLMFSQESVREAWRELPTAQDWRRDRRFLAALNYLLELTYTSALIRDSYPIQINRDWVKPGTHFTHEQGESGHNYIVHRVRDGRDGAIPIALMSSTLPRTYRSLLESDFDESNQPTVAGFLRLRWPVNPSGKKWQLTESASMPGYSLEQYSADFTEGDDYGESVLNRVAPDRMIDSRRKVESLLTTLLNRSLERETLVQDGYRICHPNRCAPDSREYDDYSTPSRDQRLFELISFTQNYVKENPETSWTYKNYIWNHGLEVEGEHWRTRHLTLDEVIRIWQKRLYSSDPNDTREKRWGL